MAKVKLVPESQPQFRRRVLVVDGDQSFIDACSAVFQKVGYEVLHAHDGFEALCALRGAIPDLVISELNLPRMSGFELLSIVRSRFPQIAVIAISADYTPVTMPSATIADAFVAKGPKTHWELLAAGAKLIRQSPMRASRVKSPTAVAWVTKSPTGYVILTCPECLRTFSIEQPKIADEPYSENCVFCDSNVTFYMMSHESAPAAVHQPNKGEQMLRRSREAIRSSRDTLKSSGTLLEKRNPKM